MAACELRAAGETGPNDAERPADRRRTDRQLGLHCAGAAFNRVNRKAIYALSKCATELVTVYVVDQRMTAVSCGVFVHASLVILITIVSLSVTQCCRGPLSSQLASTSWLVHRRTPNF